MSIHSVLVELRQAIDAKLPEDQRGAKTIAEMTSAVNGITAGGGGGIDFYECTSYTPDFAGGLEYSFTLSGASDPEVNGTYIRTQWVENIDSDTEYATTAVWANENGCKLQEEYEWGDFRYYIISSGGDYLYNIDSPFYDRLTDYNNDAWYDWNIGESVALTFSAWIPSELPPTTEAWSGRKVVQDTETGLWSRTDTVKENMTAPFFTPEVGKVFSEDTSIACAAIFNESAAHLVALYHFDGNYIDITGKTSATLTEKYIEKDGKFDGCMRGDSYNAAMADSSYYMTINGLPEMDAFTVEWWQKDEDKFGDGGAFLWQPEEGGKPRSTFATVNITSDDSRYIYDDWKHFAFVRNAGSSTVAQYLNGKNVGTVDYADTLGGRTVKFTGLTPTTGQAKTVRVDELAIYSVAKYDGDFTPPNSPTVI